MPATATYHLAIDKYQATSNHRFAVFSIEHGTVPAVASGSIASPADASGVLAVGAISQLNWTTGPLEYFSSRGPTNDGRTKPEISGPDYVTSYTYGGRFSGTSAASPYVAGAAAILLSANPTYSVSQLWNALTSTAVDMGISGQDNSYGFGRLNLPPIPLIATTGSATSVTTNSAALNGTVHINGISTIYYFEYGTTASYGSKTPETVAGSGFTKVPVSAELTGLRAGKTYHFRLAAANSGGTSYGGDAVFTTQIVDSDGDGLEDGWEVQNFGNLTTADHTTDSDGDGLLDKEEFANETDPLRADTDGDGDNDKEEVMYGSDPLLITDTLDSHRPYKPAVSDSAGDVPLRDHVFDADGFSDPDQPLGDYLSASEWQISTDQNFGRDDIILQRIFERPVDEAASIAESKLRQLLIQHGILLKASSYWIRTRHRDSVGLWSAWSDAVAFKSEEIDEHNDTDENGIDDQSQVQGYADTNNNGIDDASEDILAFFGEKGDLIGMGTSNGTVGSFDAIPNSEIPVELIPDDPMPYGFFSFRIDGLPVDAADPAKVDIFFFFPTPLPANIKWYKFDPAAGTMTDFTANASITGNTAVISLTDGSSGDADGVVNGVIIDPGGPAVILAPGAGGGDSGIGASDSGGGGGGGGGCFITNATSDFRLAETYSAITLLLVFFVICIVKITTKQPGRI